jgi:hypothetical protein
MNAEDNDRRIREVVMDWLVTSEDKVSGPMRHYAKQYIESAESEVAKLLLQIEEQQKKTDMLYLGVLGWFGYWRDKLPAEVAPSFHHAVDSIMRERGRLSHEYVNQLREMVKALDEKTNLEKRKDQTT